GRWHYRRAAWTTSPDGQQLAAAAQDVTRALELAPTEAEVLLAAADLAQLQDNLKQARAHLQAGLKLHPREMRLYRSLALLALRAGHRPRAVACLRTGAKAVPPQAQFELLWDLANLLIDGAELDQADAVIAQIRQANATPASVDYLHARMRMHEGHWPEAA